MKLYYSHYSPFSRKVRIVIEELALHANIDMNQIHPETHRNLIQLNPLADVPVLVLDDQRSLFDSSVICKYLNSLNPANQLYPNALADQIIQLQLEALADGMVASVDRIVYENEKIEIHRDQKLIEKSWKIIHASLAFLEEKYHENNQIPSLGNIATACILDYLGFNFRNGELDWKAQYPNLAAWFEIFKTRPSMKHTKYHSI
ncbi:glutathione S-transferase family protein [Acinetobacter gerneri]|jgi:glutathione S-transferase|uniref:GST N-terminal domain-containing protein n=1 Tax=Acinetobacter gerneri DSM 14967 = CIP 107464 = MTCC 9824 TaxID=1120926 RepID=N8ZLV2_9GAMM|nr:glutathione S-transferase family protein [Acinetobacter gerneri]ENV32480.1 hypothetical protein F960_03335 [Acinetobacter gerneri DSM 14967 = CIP 107464 = MTCC 9824]EPR81825.1 Glutathione S-transferase family protein [Acinetobacter gerneri DSM 14967 = CIP 107464 = MTCC 9824]MCH4245697.1 glutathione S-transferase family protein [Acinetobacter gerneri]